MNMENIIFTLIIAVAVIYLGRKIVLFFTSKEPPKCSGCCNVNCPSRQFTSEETEQLNQQNQHPDKQ